MHIYAYIYACIYAYVCIGFADDAQGSSRTDSTAIRVCGVILFCCGRRINHLPVIGMHFVLPCRTPVLRSALHIAVPTSYVHICSLRAVFFCGVLSLCHILSRFFVFYVTTATRKSVHPRTTSQLTRTPAKP